MLKNIEYIVNGSDIYGRDVTKLSPEVQNLEGFWMICHYDCEGRQVTSRQYINGRLETVIKCFNEDQWVYMSIRYIHIMNADEYLELSQQQDELKARRDELEKQLADIKSKIR